MLLEGAVDGGLQKFNLTNNKVPAAKYNVAPQFTQPIFFFILFK